MPSCMGLPKLTSSTDNPGEIPKANAKLQPIVSTCGTFYYDTVKYLVTPAYRERIQHQNHHDLC